MTRTRVWGAAMALGLIAAGAGAQPLTSAFTYQGELQNGGGAATGLHDFRFRLYASSGGGAPLGAGVCVDNVVLDAQGRFSVVVDFGLTVFAGDQRFLEIEVRADTGLGCSDATGFVLLSGRQALTAAPHATYALVSGSAALLNNQPAAFYQNAGNMSAGTLPGARLNGTYGNALTITNAANVLGGNGAAITGLSASNVTTGTLVDAVIPANVARRNQSNTFTGASNLFSNDVYVLDQVGIGTSSPAALLHVRDGAAVAGASASANAAAIIERNANAYLNFLSPTDALAGVLFGSSVNGADGGVLYDHTTRSMWLRTGGNVTRATISPIGWMSLGTTVATSPLHVQSSLDITAPGSGILTLGNYPSGTFMHVDGNEIQTYVNEVADDLLLNALGGNVGIGATAASPTARLDVGGALRTRGAATVDGTLFAGGVISGGNAGFEPRFFAGAGSLGDTIGGLNSSNGRYCRFEMTEDASDTFGAYFEYNGIQNFFEIGTMDSAFTPAITIDRGSQNVDVIGNISKGGGSFRIDHPLDPENTYLSHSFVESPDMKNIYDGVVTTDESGYAVVTLPGWFEALNRDFRFQLTVVDEADSGGFVMAKVASALVNSRFTIRTSSPGTTVSWQVTGIRKDAYANAHRIPVEHAKAEAERGRYLHPEAFGKPASMGIGYRARGGAAEALVHEGPKPQGPQDD